MTTCSADRDCSHGDGIYIYPGSSGPISSLRFEALRDGLQDWELLDLLKKVQGEQPATDLIATVIRSPSNRSDMAAITAARREAIARILAGTELNRAALKTEDAADIISLDGNAFVSLMKTSSEGRQ